MSPRHRHDAAHPFEARDGGVLIGSAAKPDLVHEILPIIS